MKDNTQLPENNPAARKLGEMVLRALDGNALFTSASLPFKVVPPLFNRYTQSSSRTAGTSTARFGRSQDLRTAFGRISRQRCS